MGVRKIVNIDEDKCNGCGLCVSACHEGALAMINGKAKLIKDDYCDGLGDCLPECPTGAITITEREAADFDAEAVKQRMGAKFQGCPGSRERVLSPASPAPAVEQVDSTAGQPSQLRQWPVQLRLISTGAAFLQGAHLLLTADCAPLAYAGFHEQLLKGRIAIVACPKLDDFAQIVDKLADIFRGNDIASITIARMEVPCCGGLSQAVAQAMKESGKDIPLTERIITIEGQLQ